MESVLAKYYLDLYKKVQEKHSSNFIFRGQSSVDWKICSSAQRRIIEFDEMSSPENNSHILNKRFIRYHKKILEKIKAYGYGNSLTDLELMAEVQHFGGATCLIDFTTNFFVALWFASSSSENDGCVYAMDIQQMNQKYDFVHLHDKKSDILQLLKIKESKPLITQVNVWKPNKLLDRIYHQDSVLVFSYPEISGDICEKIIIDHQDKLKIRRELKIFFKIDSENIYGDIHGFSSNANGVDIPLEDYTHLTYYEIARGIIEKMPDSNESAILYLEKCKDACKKDKKSCSEFCRDVPKYEILYYLSACYRKNFEHEKAEGALRQILKYDKVNDNIHQKTLLLLADRLYDKRERSAYLEAISLYEKVEEKYKELSTFAKLSIIELSLLANDKKKFSELITKMSKSSKNIKTYEDALLLFFEDFGNIYFNLDTHYYFIEQIKKTAPITISEDLYFEFKDLENFVEEIPQNDNNKTVLIDLINSAKKYQNICK